MNSAKKIMKNNGVGAGVSTGRQGAIVASKNKILILIGIILVAILCGGVCYINLRPRAILKVEGPSTDGNTVTNTVNYPEAMYDIYTSEYMYTMYGVDMEQETEDGDTYGDVIKKSIMDGIKQREILYMAALKEGLSLTDEEKKTVKENVESTRKNMTDKQKEMKGLDSATLTTVLQKEALGNKYKENVIASLNIDEAALKKTVSKKDYRQYTLQYYTFAKTETSESSTEGKKKDAKVIAQGKKDIEALRAKALKAKDFTKDIITDKDSDNTDDKTGISYATKDLIETDTDFLDAATLKVVKKMKNKTISEVLETTDAYYVIKMVNNNDSEAYDSQCSSVVEQEKETQFNSKYTEEIKALYTAKAQSFWTGRVNVGNITLDTSATE